MKEFITNPKNKVAVFVVSGVVIVLVVVALLFEAGVFAPRATQEAAAPAAPAPPVQVAAPAPAAPVAQVRAMRKPGPKAAPKAAKVARRPSPAGKKAAPVQVASAAVAFKNPFQPAYDARTLQPKPPPIVAILPTSPVVTPYLPPIPGANPPPQVFGGEGPPPDIRLGRVSGIILSNGVHAIYEANGQATIVQPGDMLPDGNGKVQSIQADGITIRLTDNQIIRLPVSGGTG